MQRCAESGCELLADASAVDIQCKGVAFVYVRPPAFDEFASARLVRHCIVYVHAREVLIFQCACLFNKIGTKRIPAHVVVARALAKLVRVKAEESASFDACQFPCSCQLRVIWGHSPGVHDALVCWRGPLL